MPIAATIHETALRLAQAGAPEDEAVRELLDCCGDKRVAVVLARQRFVQDLQGRLADPVTSRAVEQLDRVLDRLPG